MNATRVVPRVKCGRVRDTILSMAHVIADDVVSKLSKKIWVQTSRGARVSFRHDIR